MSEVLRNIPYVNTRILIESERVLDPQFDDAILHVTGAQIELLRNVAQYLDRLTTFVAGYGPHYYKTPDSEDWDSITAIVANLQEKLMGNNNVIFGYYAQLFEDLSGVVDGTGAWSIFTDTPDAGEIWKVEILSVRDNDSNPTLISIQIEEAGEYFALKQAWSPGINTPVVYSGAFTLKSPQRIHMGLYGATTGSTISALMLGYKMQVST